MPLIIELEAVLFDKGKKSSDLIQATGHTSANISKLRNGKIKAIRLSTLYEICLELDCQPGDIIKVISDEDLRSLRKERAQTASERLQAGIDHPTGPEKVYVVDLNDD